jgi:hypothetical protein
MLQQLGTAMGERLYFGSAERRDQFPDPSFSAAPRLRL